MNPYRKQQHRPTDRAKVQAAFRMLDTMTGKQTGLAEVTTSKAKDKTEDDSENPPRDPLFAGNS